MRKLFSGIVLILFLSSMFTLVIVPPVKATTWTDVTVVTAKNMIDSNPSLVILDVRNQSEYDPGHIRNAKLIPLYELAGRLNELNKTDNILVYCKAGGRSLQASELLANDSFLHVYNMLEGFTAWVTAGYTYFVKYPSIQAAINSATQGASIYVSIGNYTEHLIINKTVNLIGEDEYTTIINGLGVGTIFKVEANNVSINSFTAEFCGCSCKGYSGISVEPNYRNVTISSNKLFSDGYGILINSTQDVTLSGNNATHCDYTISIQNSSNVLVSTNYVGFNGDGIDLISSSKINATMNTMLNSTIGIYMIASSNNSIVANLFESNQWSGIWGVKQSKNNSIFHNAFVSNAFGVELDAPNILDNGYPLGGNYWSDYLTKYPSAKEIDSSGIWNIPYAIDANNTDHYPLMKPYGTLPTYFVNLTEQGLPSGTEWWVDLNGDNQSSTSNVIDFSLSNGTYTYSTGAFGYIASPSTGSVTVNGANLIKYETFTVIPEFPSFLILPLMMIVTLLAVAIYRRKRLQN